MTSITFRKITIIYLVINFVFLITILFAKANNEIDISAQKIFIDKDNDIINATGDVLIKNKQFSINSEKVIFYKEKKIIEAEKSVTVNDEYDNKYYSDKLISNDDFSEASAKNVKVRLKDKSRIVGSILKRKEGINIIKDSQ